VVVKVEDIAGNTKEAIHSFQVTPTLDTLLNMIEQFIASGEISGRFDPQIINSLRQAMHHDQKDKDTNKQTVKFLEQFVLALQKSPKEIHISSSAQQALIHYTNALIDYLN
jgi:hypothetical protein